MQHKKRREVINSVDKVGKGVGFELLHSADHDIPLPSPGTLHCWTCAEPSEGMSDLQLFTVEGSSGYSMFRVHLPLASTSQAGAVQDTSAVSHKEDLGTG